MTSMTALQLVRLAGVEPYQPKDVPGMSLRFRRGIHEREARMLGVLQRASIARMPAVGSLAWGALVTEAVSAIDLPHFLAALNRRWSIGGDTFVDWHGPEGTYRERRCLGGYVLNRLESGQVVDVDAEIDGLDRWLVANGYPDHEARAALWEFSADLILVLHRLLPMPLWAHVVGLQRLTPLTADALIRRATRMVAAPETETAPEPDLTSGLYLDFLDDAERSTSRSSPPGAVAECLRLLKTDPKLSDQAQRRRWSAAIAHWRGTHQVRHRADLLVIGWICHLIEFGTYSKSDPKAKTVKDYSYTLATALATELRSTQVDLDGWGIKEFRSFYAAIRLALGSGSGLRAAEGAAILSFHQFIESQFGGPSATEVGGFATESARVNAQVVWPHEINRAIEWAPLGTDDPLLARMVRVGLTIAGHGPIRTSELLRLRVADIQRFRTASGAYLEIAIRPTRGRRELKSLAAARWIDIRCPEAVETIWQWVLDRYACAYAGSDLLFGDPRAPRANYRKRRFVDLAHRLLKRATGDVQTRLHDLRHTFVSAQLESFLLSQRLQGPDRLVELGVRTGHAHPSTTLVSYGHLYEAPLRLWLDVWLTRIGLADVQRNHAAGSDGVSPPAHGWVEPMPPAAREARSRGVTLEDVLLLLSVEQPVDIEPTARRLGFDREHLRQIQAVLVQWCLHQVRTRVVGDQSVSNLSIPELLRVLGLDMPRARQSKYDLLREWLQERRDEAMRYVAAVRRDWTQVWQRDYVVLSSPDRVRSLWALLAAARVQSASLRLCAPKKPTPADQAAMLQLQEDTSKALGAPLQTVELSTRRGRPSMYLRWQSDASSSVATAIQGSGTSIEGLIALIGAACIWQLLAKASDPGEVIE